jgi:hypothetical protein
VTFHALLLKGLRREEKQPRHAPLLGTPSCPLVGRGWRIFKRFEDWKSLVGKRVQFDDETWEACVV